MSDDGNLDIKKVIERGTERTTLKDLAQRGFENVKILHENAVQELITQAVDRVVHTQTAEERSRILAESRKELDRLIKEQRAIRSRAQLLETDKHGLIEQVERLQRELQLRSELEEETLHKHLEAGLASLQSQVEDLRARTQGAAEERDRAVAELGEHQKEIGRLTADRDRVEHEGEGHLARLSDLEKELEEERSRSRGAEKARTDLVAQILALQSKVGTAEAEIGRLRAEHGAMERETESRRAETARLEERLREEEKRAETAGRAEAELRTRLAGTETLRATSERDLGARQEELGRLQDELEKSRQDAAFLRGQMAQLQEIEGKEKAAREKAAELEQSNDELRRASARELEATRGQVESLRGQLAGQQKEAEAQRDKTVVFAAELQEVEGKEKAAREKAAGLEQELALQQKEAEGQRERSVILAAELQTLEEKEKAEREDVERLRSEAQELRARLAASEAGAEAARQETAFLKGQIAQQQRDTEAEREKTVIVTAELQEIEERQRTEEQERESLRKEVEAGRGELEALQDLLRREQEAARTAQNESVSLQARHQEILSKAADRERELDRLRAEQASRATAEEAVKLADLLERARQCSAAARASALRSREVTAELERTLARQLRPKGKKRGGSIRGGAAFDGMALLDDFFRKIRLKEHFQKHLPVKEQPGRPHPAESMAEVLKAIVAGNGSRDKNAKAVPLEVVGPSGAPGSEALRKFLGGLSTKAVQSLDRVHHGLRLHLSPLPKKPQALVLDVAPLELGLGKKGRRTVQPLVCFDPEAGEFWNSHFRSSHVPAADGILPFLKTCLGRVPAPFARGRIRFRMDSRFFNEAVVRFLDSKGVSYVIQAPDTADLRKAARRCAFTRLSNGWEVGQFAQRLHPIRRTQGRFMVVRRRLSKKAREAGAGLFRDERHVYHVFATDRRGTPWRSFELWQARPASLEKARHLLSEFTTSPLLGRSRRSVAALFQAHLLASDLLQSFRRSCLPREEKGHGLEELRGDFLLSPSRGLTVLPRRDRRRRLFSRVARLTRRLKPARPFRLRP